ncbi:Putative hydroxylase/desaturase AsaB [Septoria linicola]|uniref:Hydroxylase/desaturase AsaB n=1 Tax=Septoria linicola TaxID=215465 RepID=A0A9Q9EMZ4_9PEZI|nr:Putative hydroxylase/desaturase AsaB [Septoria linicola]
MPTSVVKTTLNYFLELENGGGQAYCLGTVGEKRRKYQEAEVNVNDIRGHEQDFHLDGNGFQFLNAPCTEKTFDDDERIKESYYPEVIDLIKRVTGATLVKPRAHTVRRWTWEQALETEKHLPDEARSVGPATSNFVHCDLSINGARDRISKNASNEDEIIPKCRWAMINVWRPFDYPVTRNALCVVDSHSIRPDELRKVDIVFPVRRDSAHAHAPPATHSSQAPKNAKSDYYALGTGYVEGLQLAAPRTPDQHKWYYLSKMTPDEVLLLKIADSRPDVANFCFHTSFASDEDYGPDRHSIEVRCAVFREDQAGE